MGDGDLASWVGVLDKFAELPVKIVAPGHGELSDKNLLATQKKYFVELRAAIEKLAAAGKTLDQIKQELELPMYKEWTKVDVKTRTENIEHVYGTLKK
jgi:cyclase